MQAKRWGEVAASAPDNQGFTVERKRSSRGVKPARSSGRSHASGLRRCHDAVMLDPYVFGPAVTNASVGIASLLYSVRRNLRIDAADSPHDGEDLLEAHVAFQQAAVSVLYRLTYLAATGLPPSRLGILWTWPASYRATRDFPAAIESLHLTFSAAAMSGPTNLLDASAGVFEAIGRSCAGFAMRGSGKASFDALAQEAYQELGRYTAALREQIVPAAS